MPEYKFVLNQSFIFVCVAMSPLVTCVMLILSNDFSRYVVSVKDYADMSIKVCLCLECCLITLY